MAEHPNQPTATLVEERAAQLFSPEELPQAMAMLHSFGTESSGDGNVRMHLALLKLCDGSLEKLARLIEQAREDYRDILAWAESPGEMRRGVLHRRKLSLSEIRDQDRRQYLEWLNRKG